ncbi:hypothetical protein C8N43_0763 [Litoreibacter ponti]|uniref:Uncharacterized protein n=1 Tax=Litoreibacter ponti TaxID=1510457 RepID=A0A2T6BJ93_9RHOB|nr:hypothetical protein [Litoreibacter ponti]PTX56112.1 hypothetical protein C8N43_0763 [Litoreibacter ponti]
MKGSHSRLSHQPEQRYSNLAHVQGGMLTEADLTEAGQIHQARDDAQGAAFAGAGVPAEGGMCGWDEEGQFVLLDGTVFAQGKQGHFELGGMTTDLAEAMKFQADLPQGPEPTPGLVYVDLWERPVFATEDGYLADAGLHGAETSYRTRTMVQLKTLPTVKSYEDVLDSFEKSPAFLPKGTATLNVQLRGGETSIDTCDPCADIINIDKVLPNALFRVEVLSVEREKGEMKAVRLAWSMENAEAVEPMGSRSALSRDNAVYEYFSDETDMQAGYFHDDYLPARGAFTTDLTTETPSDDTLEKKEVGYTHVRRWDGMARVPLGSRSKASGPSAAGSAMTDKSGQITFSTEMFTVQITHGKREMVAGDYWLVELRRYAPDGAQVLLNGHPLEKEEGQPPLGPVHHFCPIGMWNGEGFEEVPDILYRRLSFPTLADIPADHVGYFPDPDCALLGETQTVQEALDRVCEIDARHVGFTPSDPDCDTLQGTRSVDEALNKLCAADNNKQLQLMLRTMMDWGVVCGVSVAQGEKGIEVSGGVVLDRAGVLHELERETVVLSEFDDGQLLPDAKTFAGFAKRKVEICLSVGFNGTKRAFFLSPANMVYDPSDLTLSDRVEACLEGRGSLTESDLFEKIAGKEEPLTALTMMHVCLRNDIRPMDGMEFDKRLQGAAETLLKQLVEDYGKRLQKTGDPLADRKVAELNEIIAALESGLKDSGLKGTGGQLALVAKTLGLAAIMKKDEEFRLECLCTRVVPDCPPAIEGWTLVPLGCVELSNYKKGSVAESDVCMMCCRKQANTPRSQRYYNGDLIGTILSGFKALCTEEELRVDNGPSNRLRAWLAAAGPAPWDPPNKTPLWPAKPTYGDGGVQLAGPFYGHSDGGAEVLNQWKRGFNPPIIDITGQKSEEAIKKLEGAGLKVVEKFNVKNIAGILEMSDGKPLLNRRPGPGDEVILLDNDGLAVEFVVIRQARRFNFIGTKLLGGLKFQPGVVPKTDFVLAEGFKGGADLGKLLGNLQGKNIAQGGKTQPAKDTKPQPEVKKDPDKTAKAEVLDAKVMVNPALIKKQLQGFNGQPQAERFKVQRNTGLRQNITLNKDTNAARANVDKDKPKDPAKAKATTKARSTGKAKAGAKNTAKATGRRPNVGNRTARKTTARTRPGTPREPK